MTIRTDINRMDKKWKEDDDDSVKDGFRPEGVSNGSDVSGVKPVSIIHRKTIHADAFPL